MKFFSRQFPNVRVWGTNPMQFKDGVYETSNDSEIKELLRMGFEHEGEAVSEAPSEGKKHVIPAKWSTERIKKYAEDNGIAIPDNILLRKDIIQFIENS